LLVNPRCVPDETSISRASGAADILENIQVVPDLAGALQGCQFVFGASARLRQMTWPQGNPRQAAERAEQEAMNGEIAFVFGREDSGLRNSELEMCHMLVHIPANPEFSSLNIAAAVQVIAYELRMRQHEKTVVAGAEPEQRLADSQEMDGFYQHLEKAMLDIGFFVPPNYQKLMRRLKLLFNRARPDVRELNILRGILAAAEGKKAERSRRQS